jgi:hypothetical protein
MGITRLSDDDLKVFDKEHEIGMDFHVGQTANSYVIVVGGRTVVKYDKDIEEDLSRYPAATASAEEDSRLIEDWWKELPVSEPVTPVAAPQAFAVLTFIHLGPLTPLPPPPPLPPVVYGHLPFHGICSGTDVFYRYESFPTSRRIDVRNHRVLLPGTYGCPPLEPQYIASGLGAVARFALPSLFPARWGYELQPPPRTPMKYGASVPLYGQSGGGVEVFFPTPFTNNGPIQRLRTLPVF